MLKRTLAAFIGLPCLVLAQGSVGIDPQTKELRGDPLLSAHNHWAAFQASDESTCYAATLGDDRETYLKVTDREREGGGGHVVSLLFEQTSQSRAETTFVVDDQHQYSMISSGDAAWFTNGEAEEQARLTIAQGSEAEALYVTADGRPVRVRFSLRGATAAMRAAREACR
jgi:hypothetical protein